MRIRWEVPATLPHLNPLPLGEEATAYASRAFGPSRQPPIARQNLHQVYAKSDLVCSKPDEENSIPDKDCSDLNKKNSVPDQVCFGPYKVCSGPYKVCSGPYKVCSGPYKENSVPDQENDFPSQSFSKNEQSHGTLVSDSGIADAAFQRVTPWHRPSISPGKPVCCFWRAILVQRRRMLSGEVTPQ